MSIREHVNDLNKIIGPARHSVSVEVLREVHEKSGLKGVIRSVQKQMCLQDVSLRVGYVNSGGPKQALAWVDNRWGVPQYGSREFKRFKSTIFFRRSFLKEASFEMIVFAIAHELAHILLDSLQMRHAKQEKAVDVTAMYHLPEQRLSKQLKRKNKESHKISLNKYKRYCLKRHLWISMMLRRIDVLADISRIKKFLQLLL